jgi:RNA-directed DNA polymerase
MGTPQGGPLSPLLANVLLDDVDKILEVRGYSFARYADDCNVYVGSMRAGERVMALLARRYAALKLQINEAKSAVQCLGAQVPWIRAVGCQGCRGEMCSCLQSAGQLQGPHPAAHRRSGGRSMEQVVEKLRPFVLGWKAYFGLAQTPKVWRELDEWLRHRLRAIQLKHWKRPKTIYRELKVLGAIGKRRQASGGELATLVAQQ